VSEPSYFGRLIEQITMDEHPPCPFCKRRAVEERDHADGCPRSSNIAWLIAALNSPDDSDNE